MSGVRVSRPPTVLLRSEQYGSSDNAPPSQLAGIARLKANFFHWHSSSYRGEPRGRDNVFRFLRSCEYGPPQLFSVVELFANRIRPQTNYGLFIAEMPRWFRAEVLKNLDEQGVPVQISERFLRRDDTIDTLRQRLIQEARSSRAMLTPFEKRWVLDALAN
jgi:hypothetical protein